MSGRTLLQRARALVRRGLRRFPLVSLAMSIASVYSAFARGCGGF